MALREPVDVIPLAELGAVHFIAIGGAGMSGIAQLYHQHGIAVSGCDQADSSTMARFRNQGVPAWVGHEVSHLAGVETVVVSTAIRPDNVELVAARHRGLRVWHRSTALAALMLGHRGVAVAGTHGKTTTTAMTATMLKSAGADPSYVVGAPLASTRSSSHLGQGEAFVVEADESDGSFLQYPAEIVVITNIEADHLDEWGSPKEYAEGFRRFATAPGVGYAVINNDDVGARALADELQAEGRRVVTYGTSAGSDIRLGEMVFEGTKTSAELHEGDQVHQLTLLVPGEYNVQNAAAAYAVGRLLGLPSSELLAGIGAFTGTLRRFQFVADVGGVRIFDDYAHHPTEVRAALAAARTVAQGGRLIACFQPHLYSRTAEFAEEFGAALAQADLVAVTDIYAAREDPLPGVTGQLVADATGRHGVTTTYVPSKAELPAVLADLVRPGDLVMTLGAGDVTLVGPMLGQLLQERQQ